MGSKSNMPAPKAPDYDPPEFTLQKVQEDVKDMRAHVMCQICIRPMYEPYTISCGHTFCYSCLAQWFSNNSRRPSCPECRTKVLDKPAPAYVLRDMVRIFVSRETLLQDSETLVEHHEHQETEARILEADRSNKDPRSGGLFRGVFKSQRRRFGAIVDYEDGGITRCPNCAWELEGEVCTRCGAPAYDDLNWSEDDRSTAESLADFGAPGYPSDTESVDSDVLLRERMAAFGHHGPGTRPRVGRLADRHDDHIGRYLDHHTDGWRGGRVTLEHGHRTGDHIDGLSDHMSSLGSAASDYETTLGESDGSNAEPYSRNDSRASSMGSFLDDESQASDHEEILPSDDYSYYPIGRSSDAESSHEVSHLQNDWSDTQGDVLTEEGEPHLEEQPDGYGSSTRFSSLDPPNHCGTMPLATSNALVPQPGPPTLGTASSHQSSTSHAQVAGPVTSDAEESEASLPPPPQRNRKRRHVVDDESSNNSSASDLDTRRPRKRKSSSQDTTTVGHPSPGPQAQNRAVQSLRPAVGNQPSPIVIDSSPARQSSPNRARRRHRTDRPRIASHLRRSTTDGEARPATNVESSSRDPFPVHDSPSPEPSGYDRAVAKAVARRRQREGGQQRRNAGLESRL